MADIAQDVRRKLTVWLVAPLTFLTLLNSIDRVNVSFAALQMNKELGFSPAQYGFGVSLFFVGYVVCSFPHTALLRRFGAKRWIFCAVLFWGLVSTALAWTRTLGEFYALRFLLGVAEAGFAPGIVFIMSQWMPQRFRASSIAGTMLAVPISVIFGAPLSGWLLTADTHLAWPGWRFMFLVEGSLTVAVALVTPWLFVDAPEHAQWLRRDEKDWLRAEIERDIRDQEPTRARSLSALLRTRPLWAAAGVWFTLMSGAYGIIYWLPQVIKQLSGLNDFEVSLMSAFPWIGLGAGMLVNSWHSDLTGERHWHVALAGLVGAVGLVGAIAFGERWPALVCLTIGAFGLGAAQGAFWALPTSLLDRSVAAGGLTFITVLGSAGGLVTPPLIGVVRTQTGSFGMPVVLLAGLLCVGALFVPWIRVEGSARPTPLPASVGGSPHA
jgi:ACS family tartrate transporter-like MFS transporter